MLLGPGIADRSQCCWYSGRRGFLLTSNPVTYYQEFPAMIAVHSAASDITAAGGEMIGILLNILLPEGSPEALLQNMIKETEKLCELYHAEIMGGHSEITSSVNQPVITVTGVGKIRRSRVTASAGVLPGDEIVMTKWAGLLGTAILAKTHLKELTTRYNKDFIENAVEFFQLLPTDREAQLSENSEVKLMHKCIGRRNFLAVFGN